MAQDKKHIIKTEPLKPDLEQPQTFLKLLGSESFSFQTFDDDGERKEGDS